MPDPLRRPRHIGRPASACSVVATTLRWRAAGNSFTPGGHRAGIRLAPNRNRINTGAKEFGPAAVASCQSGWCSAAAIEDLQCAHSAVWL